MSTPDFEDNKMCECGFRMEFKRAILSNGKSEKLYTYWKCRCGKSAEIGDEPVKPRLNGNDSNCRKCDD